MRYKVILTGGIQPGFDLDQAKNNLAATFKLPADRIDRYFTGKPVAIKTDVDLRTAQKYKVLLEKSGAACSIVPLAQKAPPASPSTPRLQEEKNQQAPQKKIDPSSSVEPKNNMQSAAGAEKPASSDTASSPRVISAPQTAVSLKYTPLHCRALGEAEGGVNFNRFGSENVPFSDILLVSVYNLPASFKPKTRVMVFIRSQKKPLTVDADTIDFSGLINQQDDDLYVCLRRFITDLSSTNPALIIDSATNIFLSGGGPETLTRDEAYRASALGTSLDAEGLFVLALTANLKQPKKSVAELEAEAGTSACKLRPPEYTEDDYLRFFVGPKADKYIGNFSKFIKGNNVRFTATWHWPAFFVPFFWLMYRRLYLHALGALFLSFIPVVNLLMHIGMGLAAYYIYYLHAKSSIDIVKRSSGPENISYSMEMEGGVRPLPVYISAAALASLLVIVYFAGIVVPNIISKKQEKIMEMVDKSPPMYPPGAQNIPGMPPLPQNPEQAMQMAYDNMAMAELKKACTAAMVFLNQENEGELTMEALKRLGYRSIPEVQISIINPAPQNLRMGARHTYGSRMIYADQDCRIN